MDTDPKFIEQARVIYGIAHRRMNRKYKIAAIAEYLERGSNAERKVDGPGVERSEVERKI